MAVRNKITFSVAGEVREVFQRERSDYVNIIVVNKDFNEVFNLSFPSEKFDKQPLKKGIRYRFSGNIATKEWETNKVSTTFFINDIANIIAERDAYNPEGNGVSSTSKTITKPLL